jgi:predicted oxidoreductase
MHRAGKIACFGVSNHTVAQISTLKQFLDVPIVTTQPEFSPLQLAPIVTGELDQAIAMNLAVLAWSPLGGGRIAQPTTQKEHAVANLLDEMGSAWNVSRAAAALSWVMAHPARPIPIIGTMQAQHIAAATKALSVRWSRKAWYAVLAAAQGSPLP